MFNIDYYDQSREIIILCIHRNIKCIASSNSRKKYASLLSIKKRDIDEWNTYNFLTKTARELQFSALEREQ